MKTDKIFLCIVILLFLISVSSCEDRTEEIVKNDFESFINGAESGDVSGDEHQNTSDTSVSDEKNEELGSQATTETIPNSGADTNTDYDEILTPY